MLSVFRQASKSIDAINGHRVMIAGVNLLLAWTFCSRYDFGERFYIVIAQKLDYGPHKNA